MIKFLQEIGRQARSIIALSIVVMSFGFIFFLLYKTIPAENKDILQISAGIVLGVLGTVASYYFGSSKDKSDQEKADIVKETKQNE